MLVMSMLKAMLISRGELSALEHGSFVSIQEGVSD